MTVIEVETIKSDYRKKLDKFLAEYKLAKDTSTEHALAEKFANETFNFFEIPKVTTQIDMVFDEKTKSYCAV